MASKPYALSVKAKIAEIERHGSKTSALAGFPSLGNPPTAQKIRVKISMTIALRNRA